MQSQPYRKKGMRPPGAALNSMTKGRTAGGFNPMDAQRDVHALTTAKRRKRPERPERMEKPKRPPR